VHAKPENEPVYEATYLVHLSYCVLTWEVQFCTACMSVLVLNQEMYTAELDLLVPPQAVKDYVGFKIS